MGHGMGVFLGVLWLLAAFVASRGGAELVLCGRQASDDDQGVVPALLAEAKEKFTKRFAGYAKPYVAVLLGGSVAVERAFGGLVPGSATPTARRNSTPRT